MPRHLRLSEALTQLGYMDIDGSCSNLAVTAIIRDLIPAENPSAVQGQIFEKAVFLGIKFASFTPAFKKASVKIQNKINKKLVPIKMLLKHS